jgi:hypothetical protein
MNAKIGAKKVIVDDLRVTVVTDTFCDRPRLTVDKHEHVPSWMRPGTAVNGYAHVDVTLESTGSAVFAVVEGHKTGNKSVLVTIPEQATRELYRMLKKHYDEKAAAMKEKSHGTD